MTIYALSTVEGQSGVAIIRVSGPLSKKVINNLTGKEPKPRLATLVKIKTLKNKIIDEGLVVYFPKKQSFTGEEVAEFHIHGSTAIIETLLKELGRIKGLRPAKQGEFTKQAYLNGKMNLLQVEGLSSLIQAETEAQREKDRELRKQAEEKNWPILEFVRPIALGERVPLNRKWIAITVLTFLLGAGVVKTFKRFRSTK